jgi:hypothetical protein
MGSAIYLRCDCQGKHKGRLDRQWRPFSILCNWGLKCGAGHQVLILSTSAPAVSPAAQPEKSM